MFSSSRKFEGLAKYEIWKKWQLFHATDFQSLMYPCFTFCNILGLFPYKINGLTIESSQQRYILVTIVFCVLWIYQLVVLYEIDITGTIKFKGIPKTLERNCFYILTNFIATVTYILSRPRMHLLQTIMDISSRLPYNSYQKLSRLIHTKDIFGFFLLVVQAIFYYSTLDFDTWHKAFVPYVNLIVFQMDMLYVNCVCILKTCLETINDNLRNLRDLVVNDQPHLLRRIYHENKNPFLLMELMALKKQHLAISDTVQMLNTIFSLQLLATIILTFAEVTFQMYFCILHWKVGKLLTNMDDTTYDVFLITSITYYSIKMMLIVWACETGRDQAMKIGTTIHDLLNNVSNEQIKDEVIKK